MTPQRMVAIELDVEPAQRLSFIAREEGLSNDELLARIVEGYWQPVHRLSLAGPPVAVTTYSVTFPGALIRKARHRGGSKPFELYGSKAVRDVNRLLSSVEIQ